MTAERRIRVLIADDHPVFRSGLQTLVEESATLELAGEAADGEQAVARCLQDTPDVVLMDIRMPGMSGIEATRRILAHDATVGVLMLTMLEDDTSVFAAMRAGARGYVLKGAAPEEIIRAVTAVAAGEVILGAAIAARARELFQTGVHRAAQPFPALSAREHDILDLLAAGHSNGVIAERLALSEKTVRNNVSNIFAKLLVSDRPTAIVRAREAGLGSPRAST
jgi:Response regulator containing a CheY-like receiver domain and an HTH DNA-binding domain